MTAYLFLIPMDRILKFFYKIDAICPIAYKHRSEANDLLHSMTKVYKKSKYLKYG